MPNQSDSSNRAQKAAILAQRILENPELMESLEQMLQMLDQEQSGLVTAEDAELRALRITRETGKQLLQTWAQRKHAQKVHDAHAQGLQKHAKKKSAG